VAFTEQIRDGRTVFVTPDGKWFYSRLSAENHESKLKAKAAPKRVTYVFEDGPKGALVRGPALVRDGRAGREGILVSPTEDTLYEWVIAHYDEIDPDHGMSPETYTIIQGKDMPIIDVFVGS
jgi:hypothetical protein